jgi:hypothetical protein
MVRFARCCLDLSSSSCSRWVRPPRGRPQPQRQGGTVAACMPVRVAKVRRASNASAPSPTAVTSVAQANGMRPAWTSRATRTNARRAARARRTRHRPPDRERPPPPPAVIVATATPARAVTCPPAPPVSAPRRGRNCAVPTNGMRPAPVSPRSSARASARVARVSAVPPTMGPVAKARCASSASAP